VAVAITAEAVLPHHGASLPHTEIDLNPLSSGRDPAPIDGHRQNDSLKLTLIPMNDLVTLPHNGQHLSLKEIGSKTDKT
jgi:hypothetical protein